MRTFKITISTVLFLIIALYNNNVNGQVRIGGGIKIDVNLPEIIIRNPKPPRRRLPPVRRRRPSKRIYKRTHTCNNHCVCNINRSFGQITNQYRGNNHTLAVVDVNVKEMRNGIIEVTAFLESGDEMQLVVENINRNDYNYHYSCNTRRYENRILEITYNGKLFPLRDGSISLQPKGRRDYAIVLNTHGVHGDNFYGNFSTY